MTGASNQPLSGIGDITQSTNTNPSFDFIGGNAHPDDTNAKGTILCQNCGTGDTPDYIAYHANDEGKQLVLTLTPEQMANITVFCPGEGSAGLGTIIIEGQGTVTFNQSTTTITDNNAFFRYTFIDGAIAGGNDRFGIFIDSSNPDLDHDTGIMDLTSNIVIGSCSI